MESNGHDLRSSAEAARTAGACLCGRSGNHNYRPAGALNYKEARPWDLAFQRGPPTNLLVLPARTGWLER